MVTIETTSDCTFTVGGQRIGFVDQEYSGFDSVWHETDAYLGPLGWHRSPINAKASWAVVIIAPLVAVVILASFFRRRRLINSARHA
jgi:hypothetical protein